MSRGPPGGNDAACSVTAQGRDDEQDIPDRHTDDPHFGKTTWLPVVVVNDIPAAIWRAWIAKAPVRIH
jgi:hypothetical protein